MKKMFKEGNDLKGKRFGRWLVIKQAIPRKYRKDIWICECDCGVVKEVYGYNLRKKLSRSCGCYGNRVCWRGCGELSATYWSRLKGDARRRNKEFNITIKFGWELFLKQDRKCYLSGVSIYFAKSSKDLGRGNITASLDRVDSSRGYFEDNVMWVHKDINKMKQNFSKEKFLSWCSKITRFNDGKIKSSE